MAETLLTGSRVVLAVCGIALAGLGVWVQTRRDTPAAWPFALLLSVLGLVAVSTSATAAVLWQNKYVWLLGYLLIPVALALFSFDYYGLSYLDSRRRLAAFLSPIAVGLVGGTVIILGTPAFTSMSSAPVAALADLPAGSYVAAEVLQRAGLYYAGGVAIVAVGLVVSTVASYEHLDTGLGVTVSLVGAWPWLVYLVMPAVLPFVSAATVFAALAVCFAGGTAAAALALYHYRLFDIAPTAGNVGPERVLEATADAVVVVDGDERVLRLNDAAERLFGIGESDAVGGPLDSVFDADVASLREADWFELETTEGQRQFEATVSELLADRGEDTIGHAILLRDVTRQRTRRQRITVLNRLLRHNLRNDMSVIIGRAEVIADGSGVEASDVAEGILDTADELVTLGERAREVERMMSVPDQLRPSTSVASVITETLQDIDTDDCELNIDVTDAAVGADARVLKPVLHNLIDNAIRHNNSDDPEVTVSASVDETRTPAVEVTVADNGPGIPEQELAVLEHGDESALEHGSGLGLWAVRWGVRRMGGELQFEDDDPRGTVVHVRLPRALADPAEAGRSVESRAAPEAVADGGWT